MHHGRGQGGSREGRGTSRRDLLRAGGLGLLGLVMADRLVRTAPAADGTAAGANSPNASSVIQLWMDGRPSQTDTFDPKPGAGEDYCGPWTNAIATNVPGIRIGPMLPLLARQADKYSILRGLTHDHQGHETAASVMRTGTPPSSDLAAPSIGSVVSFKKGRAADEGGLPPYIALNAPPSRFPEAGFLGNTFEPFAGSGPIGGGARTALDLSREDDGLRDRYGRNPFGQSCLAARRLVERGAPFVAVHLGGWDTHVDNFGAMRTLLPILDAGFATLLDDLHQRGLLARTVVVWCGEFGRTPKIAAEPPWSGGRHHFGRAFSAVIAGGGFRGDTVVGATDDRGEQVADRPIYPWDLAASLYERLGIDPAGTLPHPQGRVPYLTPPATDDVPTGGLLREIM